MRATEQARGIAAHTSTTAVQGGWEVEGGGGRRAGKGVRANLRLVARVPCSKHQLKTGHDLTVGGVIGG